MIDAVVREVSSRPRNQKGDAVSTPPSAGELPHPVTSFVGREREISLLRGLIGTCRMTTLTGAGGVGKSRLALQVVREIDRASVGEVVLIELASLADASLVCRSVAVALGLGHQTQRDWLEYLAKVLRDRRMLIVLDNCEHLMLACAELADTLLRRCPDVRILATSRESLRVAGETVWRVPSLFVPDERVHLSLAELERSDGVRLFTDRASAVLPDFTLTVANAAAVGRLCRRLDGIPLALELAAARLPVLSVEQIADRLDDALWLLSSGGRVAPPRQQTLRATLDWSYRLLSESEQLLLHRFSVFTGGWTLEAAEGICTGDGIEREDVLGLLARLVDKSLVVCELGSGEAMRYRLLETVRQFATGLMSTRSERVELREKHLWWFLQVAERAEAKPAQAYAWFPWFYRENDNLRSALDWSVESRNAEAGLRMCDALRRFWAFGMGIYASEGLERLEAVLMLPEAPDNPTIYARGLLDQATISRICGGDLRAARSIAERGLALTRTVGDPYSLHLALILVGTIALVQADEQAALELVEESLELATRMGDSWRWERAKSSSVLGIVRTLFGDFTRARPLLEQAIVGLRADGDRLTLAETLGYLVESALHEGHIQEARICALESLELAATLGSVPNIARALDALLRVAAAERQFEHAVRLNGALSALYHQSGTFMWRISGKASHSAVADAQLHLGETRATEVRAQGAAMRMSEAVALGLNGAAPTGKTRKGRAEHDSPRLTARESEVLRLLASGSSNREIAARLVLSTRTVERHIENLYAKIGVSGRAGAIAYALNQNTRQLAREPVG
jgi:predicted ATPase/DNA-binding CsgD family transcriptional regulator